MSNPLAGSFRTFGKQNNRQALNSKFKNRRLDSPDENLSDIES